MSPDPVDTAGRARPRPSAFDRIGTILGLTLFVAAVAGLLVLGIAGFTPALYLLVLLAVGAFMVIQGARMRGPRHR